MSRISSYVPWLYWRGNYFHDSRTTHSPTTSTASLIYRRYTQGLVAGRTGHSSTHNHNDWTDLWPDPYNSLCDWPYSSVAGTAYISVQHETQDWIRKIVPGGLAYPEPGDNRSSTGWTRDFGHSRPQGCC